MSSRREILREISSRVRFRRVYRLPQFRIVREHRRMSVPMLSLAIASASLLFALANGDAGAQVKDTGIRPVLNESVRTTYLSCTSGALFTATIRKGSYQLGQNIVVTMKLKNVTTKPCDYPNQPPPSGGLPTNSLTVGGCNGAASFAVDTYRGQLVYANPPVPTCAALLPVLPPGAAMSGSISWNQRASQVARGPLRALPPGRVVPRGQYLIRAGAVTLVVHLTRKR